MVMLVAATVVAVGADGGAPARTGIPIIILKLSTSTKTKQNLIIFLILPHPYYFQ
jgi:hypothetical protein